MCTISRVFTSVALVGVLAGVTFTAARGGDYHFGSTLDCAECHTTTTNVTFDQNGQSVNAAFDPERYKLKGPSITETCLMCHDNQPGTSDVVGVDINNPGELYDGNERAAGQFYDGGGLSWKGHGLPGRDPNGILACTECHDQHGNNNYRNLRALDGGDLGPVAFVNPSAKGLDRYRRSNIGYVKNIGDKLCIGCHDYGMESMMVTPRTAGQYQRHPSSTQSLPATIDGKHTDARHWVVGTGSGFEVHGRRVPRVSFAVRSAQDYVRAKAISSDDEVFCLSCHKAHGSVHAYGMQWPYGSKDGATSSAGCNQCHNVSEE